MSSPSRARLSDEERAKQRYTLSDLAHDAKATA